VAEEVSLTLNHFTAEDAFTIGCAIRNRLRELSDSPAVVNIALANSQSVIFHAASRSGILPDNDTWVARKRNTVLRWGVSSWALNNKYKGDEGAFAAKFALGTRAGEFAIHGGGFPVRVKGVEGVVAVIVVSGLKQNQDHQVVVEALEKFSKEG
jgi:uncharacterized protein (UPF0303 family)